MTRSRFQASPSDEVQAAGSAPPRTATMRWPSPTSAPFGFELQPLPMQAAGPSGENAGRARQSRPSDDCHQSAAPGAVTPRPTATMPSRARTSDVADDPTSDPAVGRVGRIVGVADQLRPSADQSDAASPPLAAGVQRPSAT